MNTAADVCHIESKLTRFKIAELKTLLRSLDLRMGGNKQDLIRRILDFISADQIAKQDPIKIYTVRVLTMHMLDGTQDIPRFTDLYKHYQDSGLEIAHTSNTAQTDLQKLSTNEKLHPQESTPHVGHSLYFRTSPFFTTKRMVHTSPQLVVAAHDGKCNMMFVLNEAEMKLWQNKGRNTKFYLYCGKISDKRRASSNDVCIEFPQAMRLTVNDKVYRLSLNGIKGKQGTGRAADLTEYLLPSPNLNKISLLYQGIQDSYLMYLYVVNVTLPTELLNTVEKTHSHISYGATVEKIKQQFTLDDDDDIAISNLNVSLKDSLTLTKIKCPVRSVFCSHIDCFDGLTFLEAQFQIPTWQCPLCLMAIKFRDLSVSDYFVDVLKNTSDNEDQISIFEDGSWKSEVPEADTGTPKLEANNAQNSSISVVGNDVIILDSEDEDQENLENDDLLNHNSVNESTLVTKSSKSIDPELPIESPKTGDTENAPFSDTQLKASRPQEQVVTDFLQSETSARNHNAKAHSEMRNDITTNRLSDSQTSEAIRSRGIAQPPGLSIQVSNVNSNSDLTLNRTQVSSSLLRLGDPISDSLVEGHSLRHGTVFANMHLSRSNALVSPADEVGKSLSVGNDMENEDIPLSKIPRESNIQSVENWDQSVSQQIANQHNSDSRSLPRFNSTSISSGGHNSSDRWSPNSMHVIEPFSATPSNQPAVPAHPSQNHQIDYQRSSSTQILRSTPQGSERSGDSFQNGSPNPVRNDINQAYTHQNYNTIPRVYQQMRHQIYKNNPPINVSNNASHTSSDRFGTNSFALHQPMSHNLRLRDPRESNYVRGSFQSQYIPSHTNFQSKVGGSLQAQNKSSTNGEILSQYSNPDLLKSLSKSMALLDNILTSAKSLEIGVPSHPEINEIKSLMTRRIRDSMAEMKNRQMGLLELSGVILLLHFKSPVEANQVLMECWNNEIPNSVIPPRVTVQVQSSSQRNQSSSHAVPNGFLLPGQTTNINQKDSLQGKMSSGYSTIQAQQFPQANRSPTIFDRNILSRTSSTEIQNVSQMSERPNSPHKNVPTGIIPQRTLYYTPSLFSRHNTLDIQTHTRMNQSPMLSNGDTSHISQNSEIEKIVVSNNIPNNCVVKPLVQSPLGVVQSPVVSSEIILNNENTREHVQSASTSTQSPRMGKLTIPNQELPSVDMENSEGMRNSVQNQSRISKSAASPVVQKAIVAQGQTEVSEKEVGNEGSLNGSQPGNLNTRNFVPVSLTTATKRRLESHENQGQPLSKRLETTLNADFSLDQIVRVDDLPASTGSDSSTSIEFMPSSPDVSDDGIVPAAILQRGGKLNSQIRPREEEKAVDIELKSNENQKECQDKTGSILVSEGKSKAVALQKNPSIGNLPTAPQERKILGLLGIVLNNDLMDVVQE